MTLVEINSVNKKYSDQQVLSDFTYKFDHCSVVALLGPNGAGKSTLMKIITGSVSADSGNVFVLGEQVDTDKIATKSNIGYLPEHNPLYVEMYVREYLDYVASIYGIVRGERKNAIDRAVQLTGLSSEQGKRILHLSKGYRQRLGIAAAIIHQPKVLILDEPTTGLDPNQLLEIRSLISKLGRDHLVIFSTHIMQEVESLCDTVVILNKGKIVVSGGKEELKSEYGTIENLFYKMTE